MNNLKCFIIGLGNIGVGYDFNKKVRGFSIPMQINLFTEKV